MKLRSYLDFYLLFPLQLIKRPALQNKRVGVLRMAFRARKVFGSFEKRTPEKQVLFNARLKSRFYLLRE